MKLPAITFTEAKIRSMAKRVAKECKAEVQRHANVCDFPKRGDAWRALSPSVRRGLIADHAAELARSWPIEHGATAWDVLYLIDEAQVAAGVGRT